MNRIRKILSLVIIFALASSLLSGCILFEKNNNSNYAQVVAKIHGIDVGTSEKYSKEITKRDLMLAYINNNMGSEDNSVPSKETLDAILDSLINKELVIAEFIRLENSTKGTENEVKIRLYDENEVWKTVFSYIDSNVQSELNAIYNDKNEVMPGIGTGSTETTYPLNTMLTYSQKQQDKEREKELQNTQERWEIPAAKIPAASETRRLEALRSVLISLYNECQNVKLTSEEQRLLKNDKDFLDDFSNRTKLYEKIMPTQRPDDGGNGDGFFFVWKLLYTPQLDQVKYQKMQEYYSENVTVDDGDVQSFYNDQIIIQKGSFVRDSVVDLSAFHTALGNSDGSTPFVVYNPSDEFFYVKHILVPFSDEQLADIDAQAKSMTTQEKVAYRNKKALEIKSYEHLNGEDNIAAGEKTITQIQAEITTRMAQYKSASYSEINHFRAEQEFNDLIFKYNTDPGAFNNEKGYLIPAKDTGISHGMMEEFGDGAYDLYNDGDGVPGVVLEENGLAKMVITDYGVHFMYYSSRIDSTTNNGIKRLEDYTSVMKLELFKEGIYEHLLEQARTDSFTDAVNRLVWPFKQDNANVKIYESRYKDIYS